MTWKFYPSDTLLKIYELLYMPELDIPAGLHSYEHKTIILTVECLRFLRSVGSLTHLSVSTAVTSHWIKKNWNICLQFSEHYWESFVCFGKFLFMEEGSAIFSPKRCCQECFSPIHYFVRELLICIYSQTYQYEVYV